MSETRGFGSSDWMIVERIFDSCGVVIVNEVLFICGRCFGSQKMCQIVLLFICGIKNLALISTL